MVQINSNYIKLSGNYLFTEVARKVSAYKAANPQKDIISLGIGDITRPLSPSIIAALHHAVDEQSVAATFRGYAPEQGYDFLRQTIIEHDFIPRGIELQPDEVFISDGAKSDIGNFGDILSADNVVAMTDPVYPVYIDSNVMGGRAGNFTGAARWSRIVYIPCLRENGFIPSLPNIIPDIIYLCYPNNPTGTTLSKSEMKKWVNYALKNNSLILFDAAYEAFISSDDVPHSIYEIEGARRVAVEFRSFSKTAGFTGLRCGYTIVPHELVVDKVSINKLWSRRQCTKYNGTAYVIQRAAQAVYSPTGQKEIKENIAYYMQNAQIIRTNFQEAGFEVYGSIDAPYIWLCTPEGLSSWDFFDRLLVDCGIVVTPGVGFGPCGEGYVRLTAFGERERVKEAVERIKLQFR